MDKETKQAIDICREEGLGGFEIMERVLPVFLGTRKATLYYSNAEPANRGFDGTCDIAIKEKQFQNISRVAKRLGFNVAVSAQSIVNGDQIFSKVYFYNKPEHDPSEAGELHRKALQEMIKGKPSEFYAQALLLDREILEYARCCTDKLLEENVDYMHALAEVGALGENGGSPIGAEKYRFHQRMYEHMVGLFGDGIMDVEKILRQITNLESDKKDSYFTTSFYPCEPGCPVASGTGKRMIEGLKNADPRLSAIFEHIGIPANLMSLYGQNRHLPGISNKLLFDRPDTKAIGQALGAVLTFDDISGDNGKCRNVPSDVIDHFIDYIKGPLYGDIVSGAASNVYCDLKG